VGELLVRAKYDRLGLPKQEIFMPKVSQKSLPYKVEKYILENDLIESGDHIIVALSGGADSVCLAEILGALMEKLNFKLSACHYNHKLRGEESEADQKFVELFCSERNIRLWMGEKRAGEKIKNEEDARELRYAFFEKFLKEKRGSKVALAHQKNDLAETLLMNLIRGTGLRGIRSIPNLRKNFIRPLLSVTKDEVEDYLAELKIPYQTDKSNFLPVYTRNILRHRILPELEKINPKVVEALSGVAERADADYGVIETASSCASGKITLSKSKYCIKLDQKRYSSLNPGLRPHVLSRAVRELGIGKDITSNHLQAIDKMIMRNIGKKSLSLPHSLQVKLEDGKIILSILSKGKYER
jgi:tRNA(Ile)-lysidine synthase